MSKSKTNGQPKMMTLTEARVESEQITPAALEAFLHTAQETCHAFELRIQAAHAADDTKRAAELQKDAAYARAQKRRDYFAKQIAEQFPQHTVAQAELKVVERQIVLTDYLSALRLKRDAKIASDAAKVLGDKDEEKEAFVNMQRALKYLKYLEPKFKKFERELDASA